MKTLEQLKAEAYDCLVQLEGWQNRLKEANEAVLNYKPAEDSSESEPISK